MRSFTPFGASKRSVTVSPGPDNWPELLRRETIAGNAKLLAAAALLGMFPAIYALIMGASVPFLLASLGLAGGLVSLALHQRGQHEIAAAAQVATLMATGMVLTLIDSIALMPRYSRGYRTRISTASSFRKPQQNGGFSAGYKTKPFKVIRAV